MARETRTDVNRTEKGSVPTVPEQTRPGPVYSPAVDIFENEGSITVFADMPGVNTRDLKVDLRESVLTLTGQVTSPETAREADVLRVRVGDVLPPIQPVGDNRSDEDRRAARQRRAQAGAPEGGESAAQADLR